ncbi:MAG: S-layer homology domain-containing protein [Ruminococcaceae bacterium]|nr:S-layer homology domain-containing protein [Oscillospiraceae bacterium]
MKKLILLLLSFSLIFTAMVHARENADIDKITDVIRLLEIMHGDENGELNLSDNVTRAEFVKMAICASSYKSAADTAPKNTLFPDVRSNHWATRYVGLAISNGWINGYLDGTFRPDNNVKLEEAVNIVLKILGYTEKELVGAYPTPQMSNYKSLKLDKNINAVQGEFLTREECMLLIYNMLNTENKNGTIHAQALGYALDSNDEIDYLAVVEKNTDGPLLVTDKNWLDITGIAAEKAEIWRDGRQTSFGDVQQYDVVYYSKLINTVWAYSDKEFGVLQSVSSVASPNTVTLSGKTYTLGNSDVKYKFSSMGTFAKDDIVVVLLGDNGQVEYAYDAHEIDYRLFVEDETDYVLLTQYSLEDPFVVEDELSWKDNIPFDVSGAMIYKNGNASSADKIQKYDVVYSSKLMNTVWCYDTKKSGIVNGVSPTKSAPSSVNLSGTNYSIASDSVAFSLSELGTVSEGDVVTLLLGRDNLVEGIITADASDSSMYIQGDLDYQQIVNASIEGPYIVNGTSYKDEIDFELDSASIYRNDEASNADAIREWDVYYYSKPLKTVWVYSKKVSGRYEAASPDKSAPSSVVVSGKSYLIENTSVSHKLSSAGEYAIGDNVTLLLGKSGGIAGVVSADEVSDEVIGFITDFYTKDYTTAYGGTYTSNCISVTDFDGNTMEFPTTLSYTSKGKMVSVKVTSSGTKISVIAKTYTSVKDLEKAMAENKYADGAKVADKCGSAVIPVYTERLAGCKVTSDDVIYYKLNAEGEIEILLLNDYTGDSHTYVIMEKAIETVTNRGVTGTYEYVGPDGTKRLITDTVFGIESGIASIENDGAYVTDMRNLKIGVNLDAVGQLTALSDGLTYAVWDKVAIYEYKDADYRAITVSDIENSDDYALIGWLDKRPDRGGLIRIIIATPLAK